MEDEIIRDLSTPAARMAPWSNLLAYFRNFQITPGVDAHEKDGLLRWRMELPVAWFNGVLVERAARGDESTAIQNEIEYFQTHGSVEMSWWQSGEAQLSGWDAQLKKCGFSYRNEDQGMGVELARLPEIHFPEGLRVEHVANEVQARTWVETFFEGFGNPRSQMDVVYRFTLGLGLDYPVRNYLGYLENQTVATSSLFLGAGVAGLYYVTTLEKFRGRGFGSAMTLFPLVEARKMGCRVGVLQASKMGAPVYQKLGFETTCQNGYYYRSLEKQAGEGPEFLIV